MRIHLLLIAFAYLISVDLSAQTKHIENPLIQKLLFSDSIWIISHKATDYFSVKEEKPPGDTSTNENEKPAPKFFIDGKLNAEIIVEKRLLPDSAKSQLIKILFKESRSRKWAPAKCDDPRHSIIIFKNNIQSYIDICFGCERIHTSPDIEFSEGYMDNGKWLLLKNFYKKFGLTKLFDKYNQ